MMTNIEEVLIPNRITLKNGNGNLRYLELLFNGAEAHLYFAIDVIKAVTVIGLEGQRYINQLRAGEPLQTQTGPVSFSAETDRIYTNTGHDCTIIDSVHKRNIHISKENSLSTVVWNPWIDKSIRMPDFGSHEYLEMVCVETANCSPNPVILSPGKTHALRLDIQVRENIN